MTNDYSVEITQEGPSGGVHYREGGGHAYSTWWEFATGSVLAFVMVPTPESWDADVPWAAGRREEILARIGQEVVRQQASGHRWVIEDSFINIVKA